MSGPLSERCPRATGLPSVVTKPLVNIPGLFWESTPDGIADRNGIVKAAAWADAAQRRLFGGSERQPVASNHRRGGFVNFGAAHQRPLTPD